MQCPYITAVSCYIHLNPFSIVLAFVFKKRQTVLAIDQPYIEGTSFFRPVVNISYFSVPRTGLKIFFRFCFHCGYQYINYTSLLVAVIINLPYVASV
jgi:hypothetical protein